MDCQPSPQGARILEWVRDQPVNIGLHRRPRGSIQGPNIGSNEPSRFPEIVGDAFRASLTWSVELSGSLRSVTLSLFRAGAGASGVVLA